VAGPVPHGWAGAGDPRGAGGMADLAAALPPARCLPRAMEAATQRRRRAGCRHARARARCPVRDPPVRRRPPLS